MKIRNGFVSNSSSSSFVIFGDPDKGSALEYAINKYCIKIEDEKYRERILNKLQLDISRYKSSAKSCSNDYYLQKYEEKNGLPYDSKQPMYLSSFISDCNDDCMIFDNHKSSYEYYEGGHGGPWLEVSFICLDKDKGIWVKKTTDEENSDDEENYITSSDIDIWSSLKNAKLIGHNLSNKQIYDLNCLSKAMKYSLYALYNLENGTYPDESDIEYLMENGRFVCELCKEMKPRFEKLMEIKND